MTHVNLYHRDLGLGPPVIFVHGFPLDGRMWQRQATLAERIRIITPDLPGAGRSPHFDLGQSPATLGHYADAVIDLLDRLELEKATLCGLSMGGYILFEIWRRAPQRIASLIFCDTRAEADSPDIKQNRRAAIQKVIQGRRAEVTEPMLDLLLAPPARQNPDLVDDVRAMMDAVVEEGLVAALQAMHDRPDSLETLRTIVVPALVIVGSLDSLTPPPTARVIQQGISHSRLVEIPDAGHLSPLENPRAFNAALVEFLLGIPGAS